MPLCDKIISGLFYLVSQMDNYSRALFTYKDVSLKKVSTELEQVLKQPCLNND